MTEPPREAPEASVIVAARNARQGIRDLIAALSQQTLDAARFELVLIDDASTEQLVDADPPAFVTVVRLSQNVGAYAARNAGVAQARGTALLFTDADCVPDPSWLERALACMRDTGADLVAGNIVVPLQTRPTVAELVDVSGSFDQQETVKRDGTAVTANLLVTRAAFDELGGFQGQTISGGDREFCRRARARGYRIVFAPEATVTHEPRSTARALARKAYRYGVGRAQLDRHSSEDFGDWHPLYRRPGAYIPRRWRMDMPGLERNGFRVSRSLEYRMRAVDYLFQRLPMLAGNIVGSVHERRRRS